jgi:FAD/FMN-containing dehydrogenase
VADETEMSTDVPGLKKTDWLNLLHLAHTDKSHGFDLYQKHYQRTDGAVYWSDSHQFTTYVDGYHQEIDRRMGSQCQGSEMISELYVPRDRLPRFLSLAREDLRRFGASVIYGTVRLIEQEHESFLNWARESWACVIFNICVEHSQQGLRNAQRTFRGLIDRALEQEGSYYLTYHKFARRDQVEEAYPQFAEFLRLKKDYDPRGLFQSNWWRHHETLFADA